MLNSPQTITLDKEDLAKLAKQTEEAYRRLRNDITTSVEPIDEPGRFPDNFPDFIRRDGTVDFTGAEKAADHSTGSNPRIVNICYGTSATPPAANTTTHGTIYVQYTA